MNYYLINLLTVLLFQPNLISCIGSINILPALPFGQYKLIFKQIKSCDISQNNEIQNNFYLFHNPKSNATEIKGNITISVPLDDTLFLEMNFAMKDANGHWKENTYFHKSPKGCSSFRNLLGTEWTKIMNGLGVKKATCPIPPGQYQLIFKQIKSCDVSQVYKLQHNFYVSVNPKSNAIEIRGNMTNIIPFDDTLFLEANFALSDAHGNWKDNTYIHKSPKACSAFRSLMGGEWTRVMNGLGIKNATCPVPPGIYIASGLDTSIFTKNTNFPKSFIYGTYKLRFFYSRNKEIYGCNIFILEVKPL